jgi:hypothetical protein
MPASNEISPILDGTTRIFGGIGVTKVGGEMIAGGTIPMTGAEARRVGMRAGGNIEGTTDDEGMEGEGADGVVRVAIGADEGADGVVRVAIGADEGADGVVRVAIGADEGADGVVIVAIGADRVGNDTVDGRVEVEAKVADPSTGTRLTRI